MASVSPPDAAAAHDYVPLWEKMHGDCVEKGAEGTEWHLTYEALQPLTLALIERSVRVQQATVDTKPALLIDVGCGSSNLGVQLLNDLPNCRLMLLDVVPSLIEMLQKQHAADPRVMAAVDDCRVLDSLEDASAAVIIDKGTIDAMDNTEERSTCLRAMVAKLCKPHGLLVSVSFASAARVVLLRREAAALGLQLRLRFLPAQKELRLVALMSWEFEGEDAPDEFTEEKISMLLYKGPLRNEPYVQFQHPGLPAGVQLEFEQVIDSAGRCKSGEDDATGCLVWPAAHAFSAHLCAHPELVRGLNVIDLGAGTGVAGLAAAALGAKEVVLTDLAGTMPLLNRNVALNDAASGGRARTAELWWSKEGSAAILAESGLKAFDVVIGCEIVYSHSAEVAAALVQSMEALAGASGICLFVYEFRGGLVEDMEFFDRAAEAFDVETVSLGEYGYGIPRNCDDGDEDLWRMLYIYRPKGPRV